uniref:Interferon lambda-4 n=1 Tax=Sus scrofa TaxID=9823 RepID=A0A4X1SYY2_PIG
MGPRGTAAVAMGLWVFVTAVFALDPEDVVVPGRCVLSHYRSLDPQALVAVKALRDHYEEETLSWRPRNCSFRLRRDPPPPSGLSLFSFCTDCSLFAEGSPSDLPLAPSLTSFRSSLKCHFITSFTGNLLSHFVLIPASFLSFSVT